MRLTVFAATLAFLLWGTPAFAGSAPDNDGDGVSDPIDNCSTTFNLGQDDTDFDDCGNYCDADYTQTGTPSFLDFGQFIQAIGTTDEEKCHTGTIPGCTVGFLDFGFFVSNFGVTPGPSGTTSGTTACP